MNIARYHMRIIREHDPDEPAEKRSKTVTNLAGITGLQIIFSFESFLVVRDISHYHSRCWWIPKSEAGETDETNEPARAALTQYSAYAIFHLAPSSMLTKYLVFDAWYWLIKANTQLKQHWHLFTFLGACDAVNVCPLRLMKIKFPWCCLMC